MRTQESQVSSSVHHSGTRVASGETVRSGSDREFSLQVSFAWRGKTSAEMRLVARNGKKLDLSYVTFALSFAELQPVVC